MGNKVGQVYLHSTPIVYNDNRHCPAANVYVVVVLVDLSSVGDIAMNQSRRKRKHDSSRVIGNPLTFLTLYIDSFIADFFYTRRMF